MPPTRNHPQTPVVGESEAKPIDELTTAASRTSESVLRVEASVFHNTVLADQLSSAASRENTNSVPTPSVLMTVMF